jgi:hypothetical protein
MAIISQTIPFNISSKPDVIANIFIKEDCSPKEIQIYISLFREYCDIFTWSYEEMECIGHWIVEHKTKINPNTKLVRQKMRVLNPKKAPTIKAKIEKLLRACYIYPVLLSEWVSNPISINKK